MVTRRGVLTLPNLVTFLGLLCIPVFLGTNARAAAQLRRSGAVRALARRAFGDERAGPRPTPTIR